MHNFSSPPPQVQNVNMGPARIMYTPQPSWSCKKLGTKRLCIILFMVWNVLVIRFPLLHGRPTGFTSLTSSHFVFKNLTKKLSMVWFIFRRIVCCVVASRVLVNWLPKVESYFVLVLIVGFCTLNLVFGFRNCSRSSRFVSCNITLSVSSWLSNDQLSYCALRTP